jgi:hypothetical protein
VNQDENEKAHYGGNRYLKENFLLIAWALIQVLEANLFLKNGAIWAYQEMHQSVDNMDDFKSLSHHERVVKIREAICKMWRVIHGENLLLLTRPLRNISST